MRHVDVVALGLCSLVLCRGTRAQDVSKPGLEARLVAALTVGDSKIVAALGKEVLALPLERRRALSFRLRSGEVSFSFRGAYPSMMGGGAQGMEYVLSRQGTQEYESLLAVSQSELERARAVGSLLVARREAGKTAAPRLELAWFDGERVRVEDLRDVLRLEKPQRREQFLGGLEPWANGLAQGNVRTDPALLPTRSVPATLIVTITD